MTYCIGYLGLVSQSNSSISDAWAAIDPLPVGALSHVVRFYKFICFCARRLI